MNFPVDAQTLSRIADVFTACPLDGQMLPELRDTLSRRLSELILADLELHPMSLTQDPVHHTRYYLAADRISAGPVERKNASILMAFFAGSNPPVPPAPQGPAETGYEIEASPWTVWVLPFGPEDRANLAWFSREIALDPPPLP